jgi:hypothetical protein
MTGECLGFNLEYWEISVGKCKLTAPEYGRAISFSTFKIKERKKIIDG